MRLWYSHLAVLVLLASACRVSAGYDDVGGVTAQETQSETGASSVAVESSDTAQETQSGTGTSSVAVESSEETSESSSEERSKICYTDECRVQYFSKGRCYGTCSGCDDICRKYKDSYCTRCTSYSYSYEEVRYKYCRYCKKRTSSYSEQGSSSSGSEVRTDKNSETSIDYDSKSRSHKGSDTYKDSNTDYYHHYQGDAKSDRQSYKYKDDSGNREEGEDRVHSRRNRGRYGYRNKRGQGVKGEYSSSSYSISRRRSRRVCRTKVCEIQYIRYGYSYGRCRGCDSRCKRYAVKFCNRCYTKWYSYCGYCSTYFRKYASKKRVILDAEGEKTGESDVVIKEKESYGRGEYYGIKRRGGYLRRKYRRGRRYRRYRRGRKIRKFRRGRKYRKYGLKKYGRGYARRYCRGGYRPLCRRRRYKRRCRRCWRRKSYRKRRFGRKRRVKKYKKYYW